MLVGRNDRTIWTCYNRAKKKRKENSEEQLKKDLKDESENLGEQSGKDLKEKLEKSNNNFKINSRNNSEEQLKKDLKEKLEKDLKEKDNEDDSKLIPPASGIVRIPVEIFKDRTLAPLECLSVHLKEKLMLGFHEIATILNRDDRTIWTSYKRAQTKKENQLITSMAS